MWLFPKFQKKNLSVGIDIGCTKLEHQRFEHLGTHITSIWDADVRPDNHVAGT